jgi:hypothetical protein
MVNYSNPMENTLGDVKNISAQLYEKQLHPTPKAAEYGCRDDITARNLTTCVNGHSSDTQIETAFQKQLNLSEAYKSPLIFNAMKRDFMDQTMESGNNKRAPGIDYLEEPKVGPAQTSTAPSGPRDFLNFLVYGKENFGLGSDMMCIVFIVIFAVLFYFLFLKK